MVIVTRKHLADVRLRYPDAAAEISAWEMIVSKVRWRNFVELRETFPGADAVIHYAKETTQGHCYVRSFLTHKQYDDRSNWDKEFGS